MSHHDPFFSARRTLFRITPVAVATVLLAPWAGRVSAHEFNAGAIRIDHPYATPTPAGARTGGVYFRSLSHRGREADQLLSASTDRAGSVELHRMRIENNLMTMRAVELIELPAGQSVPFRHGQADAFHLMLIDLRSPLKVGDRFPLRLRFRDAGEIEVMVWVQSPKSGQAGDQHRH